jgi:hypothetical protein
MRFMATVVPVLIVALSGAASAQDVFIYPARGQSAEQQNRDRYQCHTWAVQQTGFDPTHAAPAAASPPPPPPPAQAPQGGLLRGAARGAAIGAVGGAIGGDAGKGAAIGAGTGALIGGMRRRDQERQQLAEQQAYQQQVQAAQTNQSAAHADKQSSYTRAIAACLQGRGYTVN